jgi:hypothetical protein
MGSQLMAAPGSLQGPARPPAGPSPPRLLSNGGCSLRKEPISTLHSPLHSREITFPWESCRQRFAPQPGKLPQGTDAEELGHLPSPTWLPPTRLSLFAPNLSLYCFSRVGEKWCSRKMLPRRRGNTCPDCFFQEDQAPWFCLRV